MTVNEVSRSLDKWRYVVVLAKFMVHVLHPGIPKSLSVLVPSLVYQLDLDYTTVSFLITLEFAVYMLGCPISNYLAHKFGPRLVSTVGGFLTGLSFAAGAFSQSAIFLGCSFFFTGLFASAQRQVSCETLYQHFGEQYVVAVTVTQMGAQIGGFLLPYLTVICLNAYGIRGTMLLIGAILLHGLPIGAAMRPPLSHSRSESNCNSSNSKTDNDDDTHGLNEGSHPDDDHQRPSQRNEDHPNRTKGTGHEIDMRRSGLDPAGFQNGQNSYIPVVKSERKMESTLLESHSESLESIKSILCFKKDVCIFVFILLPCQMVFEVSYCAWGLTSFSYGISVGLPAEEAVYLIMMGSVGGFIGRLVLLAVLYKNPLLTAQMFATNMGIASVALLVHPFDSSLTYLSLCSSMAGFGFYGAFSCWLGVIALEVNKENVPKATAYSLMFSGISFLLSGMITGYLYDQCGSYQVIFRILGIPLIVVCAIFLPFIYLQQRQTKSIS